MYLLWNDEVKDNDNFISNVYLKGSKSEVKFKERSNILLQKNGKIEKFEIFFKALFLYIFFELI